MTPAPISVERLRELLDKATELPWRCTDGPVGYQHRVSSDGADGETVCDVERTSADAALIVAAVNALPALLHQLAELQEQADRFHARAEAYRKDAEAAERAREEACGLLDRVQNGIGTQRLNLCESGNQWLGRDIAAFLAASGGDNEPR